MCVLFAHFPQRTARYNACARPSAVYHRAESRDKAAANDELMTACLLVPHCVSALLVSLLLAGLARSVQMQLVWLTYTVQMLLTWLTRCVQMLLVWLTCSVQMLLVWLTRSVQTLASWTTLVWMLQDWLICAATLTYLWCDDAEAIYGVNIALSDLSTHYSLALHERPAFKIRIHHERLSTLSSCYWLRFSPLG